MTRALVIGSGPAGLMAADVLASNGLDVVICDAMPSFGRKFLMAGKSGLNLTKDEPLPAMMPNFAERAGHLKPMLEAFDAYAVQNWAELLGQEIFIGPTGRVFPVVMKASPLMRAWVTRLDAAGVTRRTRMQWTGWQGSDAIFSTERGQEAITAEVTVLALGGASWSRLGSTGRWLDILQAEGAPVVPFAPANAALDVAWTDHMAPHFGAALKAIAWHVGDMVSRGEATLSATGLEGGGIYPLSPAIRSGAPLFADLVPDRRFDELQEQLAAKPAKLRLAHWLKNTLRLPSAKTALFFEMTAQAKPTRDQWVATVKQLPIRHRGLRPIDEAISTAGGLSFDGLTDDLMLKVRPGVFCAGEMLDWEAPTGGYLITACLATGRWAAQGALRYLAAAA